MFPGSLRVLRAFKTHNSSSPQGATSGLSRESTWSADFTDLITHPSLIFFGMRLQNYDIYIGQSLYHDIDSDLTAMPIVYLGIF